MPPKRTNETDDTDEPLRNNGIDTSSSNFRFHAKIAWLTYARSTFKHSDLLQFLTENKPISRYIICEETHKDGTPHVHGLVEFEHGLDTKNARWFDYEGRHPRIRYVKNNKHRRAIITYCKKEGNYIFSGFGEDEEKSGWGDILRGSANKKEFLEAIKDTFPKEYCMALERLQYTARIEFPEPIPEYKSKFERASYMDDAATKWMTKWTTLPYDIRPETILLRGRSGCGKTQWTRSWGPHVYIKHGFSVKNVELEQPTAKYVVLDDINWQYFTMWKDIIGCQEEVAYRKLYHGMQTIQWNLPCIILCNEDTDPTIYFQNSQLDYVLDRISLIVDITHNVWENPNSTTLDKLTFSIPKPIKTTQRRNIFGTFGISNIENVCDTCQKFTCICK